MTSGMSVRVDEDPASRSRSGRRSLPSRPRISVTMSGRYVASCSTRAGPDGVRERPAGADAEPRRQDDREEEDEDRGGAAAHHGCILARGRLPARGDGMSERRVHEQRDPAPDRPADRPAAAAGPTVDAKSRGCLKWGLVGCAVALGRRHRRARLPDVERAPDDGLGSCEATEDAVADGMHAGGDARGAGRVPHGVRSASVDAAKAGKATPDEDPGDPEEGRRRPLADGKRERRRSSARSDRRAEEGRSRRRAAGSRSSPP